MALYDETKSAIDAVIGEYKKVVADGKISISEVFTLVGRATATFVNLFRSLGLGTESEQKETVVLAIGRFYDEIVAPIDITGIPNFLEPVVDRAMKELLLLLTRSWADSLVAVFSKSEIIVRQQAAMVLRDSALLQNPQVSEQVEAGPQGTAGPQASDANFEAQVVQRIVEDVRSAVVIY
jgi:hypothetical protein